MMPKRNAVAMAAESTDQLTSDHLSGELQTALQVTGLREFFRDSVQNALRKQHVDVDAQTEQYVVNILTTFARSDELYEHTPDGLRLRPLAHMFADAAAAPSRERQQHSLRRLGDVSLFIAGFFAQTFARKLIDVDYHIAMGGRAYATLADGVRAKALAQVFAEMARKFQRLVDVLNEVAEMSHVHSDKDVLRLYEIFVKTGSPRAREILTRLGVVPVAAHALRRQ
jgi:hypothetical protein